MMRGHGKPERPARVDLGDDALRVLFQIRQDTGLAYASILMRALMLYRAFLRAGKEEKPTASGATADGPLSGAVAAVVRKLEQKTKKGMKNERKQF